MLAFTPLYRWSGHEQFQPISVALTLYEEPLPDCEFTTYEMLLNVDLQDNEKDYNRRRLDRTLF